MPRPMSALLSECLERANPRVKHVVEVSAPDVGVTLRREDQWAATVSTTPSGELATGPDGSLRLASTADLISEFQTTETAWINLGEENQQLLLHGLAWAPAATFERARLREFQAHVKRTPVGSFMPPTRFELQVYRVTMVSGARLTTLPGGSIDEDPWTEVLFSPLLNPPPLVRDDQITWASNVAWVAFDLTNWQLDVDNSPGVAGPRPTGEQNRYVFVVSPLDSTVAGRYQWLCDTVTAQSVAGVGDFYQVAWSRADEAHEWVEDPDPVTPSHRLSVDGYAVAGGVPARAVYAVDLGRAPAAGTTGRVVWERAAPSLSAATLELSTAGATGPWTAVTNGSPPAAAQQTYHLRISLTPSPGGRVSPSVFAAGVEYRAVTDVSDESVLEFPTRSVPAPWGGAGEVGEGRVRVLRTGVRDYEDPATHLGTAGGRLEADVFLAPDHPMATRDDWLRMERVLITDRAPGETGEGFTLLSYAAKAKRTIPAREETFVTVYTVANTSADGTRVRLTTSLLNSPPYAGKGYYMRVRTSANPEIPAGTVAPISASADDLTGGGDPAGPETLVFASALPGLLNAGDTVEVHSGVYHRPALVWQDADPAQVWWDVATTYLGLPLERLGLAGLPNGGTPPYLADRVPATVTGYAALRAALAVTMRVDEGEEGWKLLGEAAALCEGATTEIAGQIVWVPQYPSRDATGAPLLPLAPVAHTFGPDEVIGLETPVGLEARATAVSSTYGVNKAAAAPDATPEQALTRVDADALALHERPDIEALGTAEAPEDLARWFFNTADAGFTLAQRHTDHVIRAASTGLRVWTWGSAEAHPALVPGDTVLVLTDQYEDYDPTGARVLKGWLSVRAVLVGVEGGGRRFRGFVQGLDPNSVVIAGGNPATQSGSGAAIPVPASFGLSTVATRTEGGTTVDITASWTDPPDPFLSRLEYAVESSPNGTTGWTPARLVSGSRLGPDRIPADWDLVFRVTPFTVSSGGTRTAGAPHTVTVGPNPEANPTYGAAVRTATYVQWSVTLDQETRRLEGWRQVYASNPGTGSIELVRPVPDFVIAAGDGQTYVRVSPLAAATDYGKATVVAYDRTLTRGQAVTLVAQGDSTVTPPAAPTSPTFVSKTATRITNSVVVPAGVTSLRIYRNGVAVGTVAALAAGATQNVSDTNLSPSTSYGHQYAGVSSAGVESALTATLTATTNAGTIATPTGFTATRHAAPYDLVFDFAWSAGTSGDGTPAGVQYVVVGDPTSPPSTEIDRASGTTLQQLTPSGTAYFAVYATKPGSTWADSALSNIEGPV